MVEEFDPYAELVKAQEAYVINPEYKTEDIYSPFYVPKPSASEIVSYPFNAISEVYQAGKTYAEKAYDYVKESISPKPTGTIKSKPFDLSQFFKPPWIFIILGIAGLWIYSVFKKG